jgi:lysophospholipase L1-like esterase
LDPNPMLRRTVLALVLLTGAACDDNPTSPSSGFRLTCPAPVTVPSTTAMTPVTFAAPTASGGQAPVTTSCTPASGSAFPAGTTIVNCQATDARAQTATCQVTINVVRLPTLEATRFLAFGDSITAGEVTVPIGTMGDTPGILPLIVVPSASYPSRLLPQLQARYTTQAAELVMVNEGKPAESATSGVPRLGQVLANGNHEVLLLLHGYNDMLGSGASAIPRVSRALDDMARDARARGLRVYLAMLTPPIPGRQRSIPDAVIRQMNDEIRVIAAGEDAELVDLYTALAPDLTRYIGVDGLHPTEAGYQRMADEFFVRIRATLEAR